MIADTIPLKACDTISTRGFIPPATVTPKYPALIGWNTHKHFNISFITSATIDATAIHNAPKQEKSISKRNTIPKEPSDISVTSFDVVVAPKMIKNTSNEKIHVASFLKYLYSRFFSESNFIK